jgi:hypothetical protein
MIDRDPDEDPHVASMHDAIDGMLTPIGSVWRSKASGIVVVITGFYTDARTWQSHVLYLRLFNPDVRGLVGRELRGFTEHFEPVEHLSAL